MTEVPSSRDAQFGPDSASYLTAIGGVVLLGGICGAVSLNHIWLSGIATLVFVLGLWCASRYLTHNRISLSPSELKVLTPFRVFEATWSSIADFHRTTFVYVISTRGQRFKIPLYSESILTRFAMTHFGWFSSHEKLMSQLESFRENRSMEEHDFHFLSRRSMPSARYIGLGILIAAIVQVLSVIH
jgi:hypothetical protein